MGALNYGSVENDNDDDDDGIDGNEFDAVSSIDNWIHCNNDVNDDDDNNHDDGHDDNEAAEIAVRNKKCKNEMMEKAEGEDEVNDNDKEGRNERVWLDKTS
jgi:hypothetical protein